MIWNPTLVLEVQARAMKEPLSQSYQNAFVCHQHWHVQDNMHSSPS